MSKSLVRLTLVLLASLITLSVGVSAASAEVFDYKDDVTGAKLRVEFNDQGVPINIIPDGTSIRLPLEGGAPGRYKVNDPVSGSGKKNYKPVGITPDKGVVEIGGDGTGKLQAGRYSRIGTPIEQCKKRCENSANEINDREKQADFLAVCLLACEKAHKTLDYDPALTAVLFE